MQKLLEHLFKIKSDTSATITITILIFLLGYFVTLIAYVINGLISRKSTRKIFIENLKSLNKSVNKQEKVLFDTIESLNIVTNTSWVFNKIEFFQTSVFREMTYKETFISFFIGLENQLSIFSNKKLKRRAFNKTWENVSNLDFLSNKPFDKFYIYLNKYNEFGNKRNESVAQLRKKWESLFLHVPQSYNAKEYSYLKQLENIILEFSKIPTQKRVTPFITHRHLVLKIRILDKKYSDLSLSKEINDIAVEASNYYQEMEIFIRNMKEQYKIYAFTLRVIYKTNEKVIQILKQRYSNKLIRNIILKLFSSL